ALAMPHLRPTAPRWGLIRSAARFLGRCPRLAQRAPLGRRIRTPSHPAGISHNMGLYYFCSPCEVAAMKPCSVLLVTAFFGSFLSTRAWAADVKTAVKSGGHFDVEVAKDIPYYTGADADAAKHKLDLYLPKGHKDFPVLFFIHGGTWQRGDKSRYVKLGD